jgi:hypothetical protein
MLAIFRLYMNNLSLSYPTICGGGGYIEGLFGKVRDLASEQGKSAWAGDYDFRRFRQYIWELIPVCFGAMVIYYTYGLVLRYTA